VVVFTETGNGSKLDGRDQLEAAIRLLERGDTLLALNPDRLARDTADLLTIGKCVVEQGAVLKILDPAITFDGTDIMAEAMLTLFGMIGRIEKHFIKERQRRGIEAAKAKGVYKARPRPLIRRRSVNSPNKGLVERRSLVVSGSAVPVSIGCSPVKMLRPHDPSHPDLQVQHPSERDQRLRGRSDPIQPLSRPFPKL